MAYIVRTHIYRHFKNYLCSITGLYFAIVYLFVLIFPFLFAYSTGEFWRPLKITHEQPQIKLTGDYALQCFSALDNVTVSNTIITDQNNADFEYLMIDNNQDGIPELFTFSITLPQSTTLVYEQCTLLLFTYFGFRQQLRIQMDAPILLSFNNNFYTHSLHLDGELVFKQKHSLIQTKNTRLIYNNSLPSQYPYNLFDYYSDIIRINETILPKFTQFTYVKEQNDFIEIHGTFKIPVFQEILYKPTVMINFKEIWIQYIYIAIPTFYLIHQLALFTLKRKIFFAHQQVYNDDYKF